MTRSYDTTPRSSRQSGFSLIEVLISIVIASVGLMGLAGMQATGLKNNHSAYHRSQATVLAYDIADRMRANMGSVNSYLTEFEVVYFVDERGRTRSKLIAVTGPEEKTEEMAACQSTSGCGSDLLADMDLYDWMSDMETALPGSIGVITVSGDIYTVRIGWDDDRSGVFAEGDLVSQVSFQL